MTKQTKTLLMIGGAAALVYFLVIHPSAHPTKVITVPAVDGHNHQINVEQSLPDTTVLVIQAMFAQNGTLAMSLNPAADVATLQTQLKNQGYTVAAQSVADLYSALLRGTGNASPLSANGIGAGAYGDLRQMNSLRAMNSLRWRQIV